MKKKNPPSIRVTRARKRNWAKGRLASVKNNLQQLYFEKVLYPDEQQDLNTAILLLSIILRRWNPIHPLNVEDHREKE